MQPPTVPSRLLGHAPPVQGYFYSPTPLWRRAGRAEWKLGI